MTCPHASPLACNAEGIPHAAHDWDFGSGEVFRCDGTPGGIERQAPGQHPAMVLAAWRKGEREVGK